MVRNTRSQLGTFRHWCADDGVYCVFGILDCNRGHSLYRHLALDSIVSTDGSKDANGLQAEEKIKAYKLRPYLLRNSNSNHSKRGQGTPRHVRYRTDLGLAYLYIRLFDADLSDNNFGATSLGFQTRNLRIRNGMIILGQINFEVFFIMLGYAVLNGLGSICFKISLNGKEGELTEFLSFKKGWIRNLLSLIKKPLWLLGVIFLVADFFVYQLALQKYEVSVVKPLVNLNLIFVITFGVFFLHEKITKREVGSIILIILGAFSITYRSEEISNVPELNILWGFSAMIFFAVIISVFMLLRAKDRTDPNFEYFGSILSGSLYGLGALFNKSFYNVEDADFGYTIALLGLFGLSYGTAFLYGQFSYSEGRMSLVSALVNIMSVIVPFIGGILIFTENLFIPIEGNLVLPWSYIKIVGLILTISGIIIAYTKKKDGS